MPIQTFVFSFPLNESIQIGDVAYYTNTTQVGSYTQVGGGNRSHTHSNAGITELGPITQIDIWNGNTSAIHVDVPGSVLLPTVSNFIMFGKDNRVNLSSMLGYFAEIELMSNSRDEGEIFSVGCEVFESSK